MVTVGAVDVAYPSSGGARSALIVSNDLHMSSIVTSEVIMLDKAAPYVPGKFYLRELPPLEAVLAAASINLDLLIVDGYVDLDETGTPGLGAHAAKMTRTSVIGVAKNPLPSADHAVTVVRGRSSKPLYITSSGVDVIEAARLVANMHGKFRIPDALKLVDRLARGVVPST